jgi:hypothetical protein
MDNNKEGLKFHSFDMFLKKLGLSDITYEKKKNV